MPATAAALRVEASYAAAVSAITRRIGQQLARGVMALDPDDLSAAIAAFVPTAAQSVAAGQVAVQQAAASFVAAYLSAERRVEVPRGPIDASIAGRTSTGRPLERVIGGGLANTMFGALRSGHSARDALRFAAHGLVGLAHGEVSAAADREIGNQGGQRPELRGWVWGLTGRENCAACLSRADGRVRPFGESMPRHGRCDCIRSIRMTEDPGTVERPTGAQVFHALSPERQAAQFRTAGEAKAALVRRGELSLGDLTRVERHDGWRTTVTERALSEVVA